MPAESRVLERAEQYIRKLSIGVNPLSGEALPEGDACKQERISKCLAYVADYLQQRIVPSREPQNAKKAAKRQELRHARKLASAELTLSPETLAKYEISEEPVSLSGFVRRLNALIPEGSGMIPLIYSDVAEILTREGVLLKETGEKGKDMNLPSPHGEEMGFMRAEADIRGHHAVYTKCNDVAQRFILEKIQDCVAQANERFARYQAKAAAAGETTVETDSADRGDKVAKERFHLTEAELAKYSADETPVPVTEIARRLNDLLVPDANIEKLYFKSIRDWFVAQGLLESKTDAVGKIYFTPTEAGLAAGVLTEPRLGKNGESYSAVLYGPAAQKLVLEHVNELG